jgi:hypothetical protein
MSGARQSGAYRFALQFPVEEVRRYAERFPDEGDEPVIEIGQRARSRGHYTLDEFRTVCRWKTVRSTPLVVRNSADEIEKATTIALADASTEVQRMDALRSLKGVGWPTASVVLHLAYPERYPILDKRALQAFGVQRSAYNQRFWEAYVREYVELLSRARVDGRKLDQALWQWSKEQGFRLS